MITRINRENSTEAAAVHLVLEVRTESTVSMQEGQGLKNTDGKILLLGMEWDGS